MTGFTHQVNNKIPTPAGNGVAMSHKVHRRLHTIGSIETENAMMDHVGRVDSMNNTANVRV